MIEVSGVSWLDVRGTTPPRTVLDGAEPRQHHAPTEGEGAFRVFADDSGPTLMRLWLTIGIASAAAVLYACDPASDTAGLNAGDGTVRGSVSALKTGTGVRDLVVALLRDGRVLRTVPTDEGGEFVFHGVDRGEYVVRITGVELSALSARHTAFEPLEQAIMVDGGSTSVMFTAVGLIPPRIVGDVRCGGIPVPGAQVRVVGGDVDQTVSTNAQGRYGATNLVAGEYAVLLIAAPCTMAPPFQTASLKPGQAVEVDFDG